MDISGLSISDIASVATAAAALAGLGFAVIQVRASEASQREATAKQIWMSYELRGFDYPQFANPELAEIDYAARTFDGDRVKFLQYEWFVSFMLVACDEVLRLGGKDWEGGVDDNLLAHWPYLGGPVFEPYMKNMSPLMRKRLEMLAKKQGKRSV